MHVPFCPLSVKKAKSLLGKKLYGVADPLARMSPTLEMQLEQAGFDISPRDYMSIAIFSAIFMDIITSFFFAVITFRFVDPVRAGVVSSMIGILFGGVTLFYIRAYPKLLIKKKVYDVERNMLYALRHMYVQIISGVPLFDAMNSVAEGKYGQVSAEFKAAIKMINTGVPIEKVLEDLTVRNPSTYFRRAMWQISNGVKSGSDIGTIMKSILSYISAEQKISIRKYGSQLNPLTVVYMMVAVILPSLGVTFLMVMSTFSKFAITETIFWGIVVFITIFQFMFIGILKSKRPNIM